MFAVAHRCYAIGADTDLLFEETHDVDGARCTQSPVVGERTSSSTDRHVVRVTSHLDLELGHPFFKDLAEITQDLEPFAFDVGAT